MGTYILILLLLTMVGVTVYAYSNKSKNSNQESLIMKNKKKESKSTSVPSPTPTTNTTDATPILKQSDSTASKIPTIDAHIEHKTTSTGTSSTKDTSKTSSSSKKPTDSSTTTKVDDPAILAYDNRKGYDAEFVKTADFKIELNDLLKKLKPNLTTLKYPQKNNKYYLNYHHFSVAMHKERNMPILTAVNIDGSQTVDNPRESDRWVLDPRIDKTLQLGADFYKNNNLDLGHLVRRLDPVWGDVALEANADTFHLTVCAPQHKNLNRVTWLSLEEFILKNTDVEDLKVSVFTGPVFTDHDFPYRNALLPLQFWKMAALIKKDGTPSVSAYVLSHENDLNDMGERGLIGETGFGEFKTYQISLEQLESLTQLDLSKVKKYDPLYATRSLDGFSFSEIGGPDSIQL